MLPDRPRRAASWLVAATGLALAFALARPAAGAAGSAGSDPAGDPAGEWVHAHAAFGTPRYPAGFTHFDYVNPQAPKGGTLYLPNPDRRTSFDKFNPYTLRGQAPSGVSLFMFEPLAMLGADEPQAMYGVLAEAIRVAPDRSSVTFRLHPRARFQNGDPVLAGDVKHSFDTLTGPKAHPAYRTALAPLAAAVVVDERTVRFDLREQTMDAVFTAGTVLPVFSRKWGQGPDGTSKPFDEIVWEVPITSGPYRLDRHESGRRIEFVRDPDYWGRDLPVRRGFFNFDRVVYRYYADDDIRLEAFKAGEFDLLRAYSARKWARLHAGVKWDDGRIVKRVFRTGTGQGLQSIHFNTRRPIFQDRRVRHALVLTYDFQRFVNKYRQYERSSSMFSNSEFAAEGLPSPGELALLEPFRAELPPEVFGPPFQAPNEQGYPRELRDNLLKARALLEEAGWKLDGDGVLRNAAGERFEFEYMNTGQGIERTVSWAGVLTKLGIRLNIRTVDFALYRARLEKYDFDTVTIVEPDFTVPSASDLVTSYGSAAAEQPGNNNFRGIRSKAVDRLIDAMARATTMQQMLDASRALDRVVMWNFWQISELWFASERVSYWDKFEMPATMPKHFTADQTPSTSPYLPWPVVNWWMKPAYR